MVKKTFPFKSQDSRRFIQQIINHTPDILYIMDLQKMKLVFINEKATEILGHKSRFLESINSNDCFARIKHLEACEQLKDNEFKEIDVRLKVKDGNSHWYRFRDIAFKRNIRGTVTQIFGQARRLHEQKLAETALELAQEKLNEVYKRSDESRRLLQTVFDIAPVKIEVYKALRNKENKIVDFRLELSNHTAEVNDYRSLSAGKSLLRFTPPYANEYFLNELIRTTDSDESGEQILHDSNNGSDSWYDVRYQKLGDGIVLTCADITKCKNAEKELKESRHFIEQFANTTPDIVYVMDLTQKSFLFINNRAAQVLGRSSEYICTQGRNIFHEMLHPDDFERRMMHLDSCRNLKEDEIKEIDVRLKVRNGTWHWFRIRDKAFKRANNDGSVVQTIGIGQDIHEQNLITLNRKRSQLIRGN